MWNSPQSKLLASQRKTIQSGLEYLRQLFFRQGWNYFSTIRQLGQPFGTRFFTMGGSKLEPSMPLSTKKRREPEYETTSSTLRISAQHHEIPGYSIKEKPEPLSEELPLENPIQEESDLETYSQKEPASQDTETSTETEASPEVSPDKDSFIENVSPESEPEEEHSITEQPPVVKASATEVPPPESNNGGDQEPFLLDDGSREIRDNLKPILMSLVFAHGKVLPIKTIRNVLEEVGGGTIREAIDELLEDYGKEGMGFHLIEVGEGLQLRTDTKFSKYVQRLLQVKPTRLSKPALETLAIIAYRQPVVRAEIEDIRGVDVGGVLKNLLDARLVRVLGKREEPGRPLIYGTSKEFLEFFNLRSLKDLPTLSEFQELTEEHQARIDSTFGREEEEEVDTLFDGAQFGAADTTETMAELEKAAEGLGDVVQLADSTLKNFRESPEEEKDENAESSPTPDSNESDFPTDE